MKPQPYKTKQAILDILYRLTQKQPFLTPLGDMLTDLQQLNDDELDQELCGLLIELCAALRNEQPRLATRPDVHAQVMELCRKRVPRLKHDPKDCGCVPVPGGKRKIKRTA